MSVAALQLFVAEGLFLILWPFFFFFFFMVVNYGTYFTFFLFLPLFKIQLVIACKFCVSTVYRLSLLSGVHTSREFDGESE